MDNKDEGLFVDGATTSQPVNLEDVGKEFISDEDVDGADITAEVLEAIGILQDQIQEPEYVDPDNLPEEDIANFRQLYKLSNDTLGIYMHTAAKLQENIKTAKTAYKVDLYTKKFKKIKEKFQDELARNVQLQTFFEDNGIPAVVEEAEVQESQDGDDK